MVLGCSSYCLLSVKGWYIWTRFGLSTVYLQLEDNSICIGHVISGTQSIYPRIEDKRSGHITVIGTYLHIAGIFEHPLWSSTTYLRLEDNYICMNHSVWRTQSTYPRAEDKRSSHLTSISTYVQVDGILDHAQGMLTTYLRLEDIYICLNHPISRLRSTYLRAEDKRSWDFSALVSYQQVYGVYGHALRISTSYLRLEDNPFCITHTVPGNHYTYPRVEDKTTNILLT